jgi:hypothetical protein
MFDAEYEAASRAFFARATGARFRIVSSAVVAQEIEGAPPNVVAFFNSLLSDIEVIDVTAEALRLRDAYLRAGVVTPQSANDALHVALATASGCAIIVSWNFRHIVNFARIPLYNAINVINGYREIRIHSPPAVVEDEDEEAN